MLCPHCGHWNDPIEHRCGRCGRRLEEKPRRSWPSAAKARKKPRVVPLPPIKAESPLPPPPPQWKQDLNQKLEEYRTRQRARTAVAEAARTKEVSDPSTAKQHIIAFDKAPGEGMEPPATDTAGNGQNDRTSNPGWRRVGRAPAAPKLPPLKKAANGQSRVLAPSEAVDEGLAERERRSVEAPAPISVRAAAGLLDLVLVLVALAVFAGVFHLMGGPLGPDEETVRSLVFAFFAIIVFYWIFYIRYIGETAGMTWLGLRVMTFDGRPPTEGQLRARALGTVLSTAAVGLGFAWAVADEEQLTWHDRMSKTYVTREPLQAPLEHPSARPMTP